MDISFENYSLRTFVGSLDFSFIPMHWQLWYRRAEHKNNAKGYDNIYLMALEGIIERNDRFTQCVRCCSFKLYARSFIEAHNIALTMRWYELKANSITTTFTERVKHDKRSNERRLRGRKSEVNDKKKWEQKKQKNKAGNMNRVHIGRA